MKNKKNQRSVALKHIEQLYLLAQKPQNSEYSKRYISLLKKYAMRHRLHLPQEIRRSTCSKCNTLLHPGKNCTLRIRNTMQIIVCNCGQIKRIGFVKGK